MAWPEAKTTNQSANARASNVRYLVSLSRQCLDYTNTGESSSTATPQSQTKVWVT